MNASDSGAERQRLETLRSYDILDTPPDGSFDHVTALAAHFFNVPISLISLVDQDRIWFKSQHGINVTEIPRDPGLCASVIMSDDAYVIGNAAEDPRTLANPLVKGDLGLRFYAAVPLVTFDGYRLGTFNIIDLKPRAFDQESERALRSFARIVMDHLELRLSARNIMGSLSTLLLKTRTMTGGDNYMTVCAWSKKVKINGIWMTFDQFISETLRLPVSHGMAPDVNWK